MKKKKGFLSQVTQVLQLIASELLQNNFIFDVSGLFFAPTANRSFVFRIELFFLYNRFKTRILHSVKISCSFYACACIIVFAVRKLTTKFHQFPFSSHTWSYTRALLFHVIQAFRLISFIHPDTHTFASFSSFARIKR